MFSKKELIYDLLCKYHTLYLGSVDSEIDGMTKVIPYYFDNKLKIFTVSSDDYDKILEIIEYIEKGELEK